MRVEASIELGRQLLPLVELSSNVHFRVVLRRRHGYRQRPADG